jgi:hypothetical protein
MGDSINSKRKSTAALLNTGQVKVRVKLSTMKIYWGHIGGVEVELQTFLTSALDGSKGSASCPGCFTSGGKSP